MTYLHLFALLLKNIFPSFSGLLLGFYFSRFVVFSIPREVIFPVSKEDVFSEQRINERGEDLEIKKTLVLLSCIYPESPEPAEKLSRLLDGTASLILFQSLQRLSRAAFLLGRVCPL